MRKGDYICILALVAVTFLLIFSLNQAFGQTAPGNSTLTDESSTQVYEWSDGSAIIISGDGDNVINIGAFPQEGEPVECLPAEITVFDDGTVILNLNRTVLDMDDLEMEFKRIILELKDFDLLLFEQ